MAKKEKAASTKAAVNKTPELAEAKKALETYLKENKLDPTKDWTKDKKHGKTVKALVAKLNKERDKAAAKYPESDPKAMKNLKKKAEKTAVTLEKKQKKDAYEAAEKKNAKKADKKEAKAPRTTKYDYPLIDGREMNSAEKKKYRMEQRKLANGGSSEKKEKKEKPAKAEKVEKPAKAKKEKKVEAAPVEKTSKKKKIKKAAKKDED